MIIISLFLLLYCNHTYAELMFSDKKHQKEA